MAYRISDKCIACGACEMNCPVGAISMGDGKYEIDKEKCIECGTPKNVKKEEKADESEEIDIEEIVE